MPATRMKKATTSRVKAPKKRPAGAPVQSKSRFSWMHLAAFALVFAAFGCFLIYKGFAASPTVTTKTGVVTHGSIPVGNFDKNGWLLVCLPSHTLPDDPLVHPNAPGASHLHNFWGNASTNAFSTVQTQEASANNGPATYSGSTVKAGTSCDVPGYAPGARGDTASYWAPVLYANGQPVTPSGEAEMYYRAKPLTGTGFKVIPQDARLFVGTHSATSLATNTGITSGNLYWECHGVTNVHYKTPPTTCTNLLLIVIYPGCYNNGPIDHTGPSGSDNERFAYAVNGACPASFPQKIVTLSEKFAYTLPRTGMQLQLSSDPGMGTGLLPTYTAHADFWNTWNPTSLQYLVDRCVNAQLSCGVNPITPIGPPSTIGSTSSSASSAAPLTSDAGSTSAPSSTMDMSSASPTTTSSPSSSPSTPDSTQSSVTSAPDDTDATDSALLSSYSMAVSNRDKYWGVAIVAAAVAGLAIWLLVLRRRR